MHILDKEAKGLAEKLRFLPLKQRRQIIAKACNLASQTIVDLETQIQSLLKAINENNSLSDAQIQEAKLLIDKADEQYFTLQENGADEAERLNWFSKARLLTSIATGFGGTTWENTADAIYELCNTTDNPAMIIKLVESEIGK